VSRRQRHDALKRGGRRAGGGGVGGVLAVAVPEVVGARRRREVFGDGVERRVRHVTAQRKVDGRRSSGGGGGGGVPVRSPAGRRRIAAVEGRHGGAEPTVGQPRAVAGGGGRRVVVGRAVRLDGRADSVRQRRRAEVSGGRRGRRSIQRRRVAVIIGGRRDGRTRRHTAITKHTLLSPVSLLHSNSSAGTIFQQGGSTSKNTFHHV